MEVIYPANSVDVNLIEHQLGLSKNNSVGEAAQALKKISDGEIIVCYQGSTDYEKLLTKDGQIWLGSDAQWWLRRNPAALGVLWERFPKLRDYLRTRTEHFIERKEHEFNLLHDPPDSYGRKQLQRLAEELALVLNTDE